MLVHLLNLSMSFLQNFIQVKSVAALQFDPNLGFIDTISHSLFAASNKSLAIVTYCFNCSCRFANIN